MAEEPVGGDQSMEDILASIRRIISEDGTEAGSLGPHSKDETLQLASKESVSPVDGGGSAAGLPDSQSGASGTEGWLGYDDLADIVEGGSDPLPATGVVSTEAPQQYSASPSCMEQYLENEENQL